MAVFLSYNGQLPDNIVYNGESARAVIYNGHVLWPAYDYELKPFADVEMLAARGGRAVIRAKLNILRLGKVVETQIVQPTISGSASGFSIEDNIITAEDRSTVAGTERRINLRVTYNFTHLQKQHTLEGSLVIAQAANRIEGYGTPTLVPETISAGDIPASGGAAGPLRFSGAQSEEYTSGASLPVTFTEATAGLVISYGPRITGNGLGTTAKVRTKLGEQKFTVKLRDKTSIEYSAAVYQQANSLDGLTFVSSAVESGTDPLPASGGSSVVSFKLRTSYTSGAATDVYPTAMNIDRCDDLPAGYSISASSVAGKGIGLKRTAPDLGTEVTAARSYTFDATFRYGGHSVSRKGLLLRQSANVIVSRSNDAWTTSMTVPAAGGSVSGQLLVTFIYASNAREQVAIREYSSLPVSDGVLTWSSRNGMVMLSAPSRGTTMANVHKAYRTISYRYKNEEYNDTSPYGQAANYIVHLSPTASFGYDPITAAAASARSHGSIAVTLVFASGATYDVNAPFSNDAGTLTAERRFTLSDIKNGFTVVDAATGSLTATNRGTTLGAARTSGMVGLNAKFTFIHSETYSAGGTVTATAEATATCIQQANLVLSVASDSSFQYANIGAGAISAAPTTLGSCLLTFASGATLKVGNITQAPAGTALGVSSEYKLLEVKNGFTAVNATTGILAATARGTTLGAARTSGVVSRLQTWSLRHNTALFPEESQNLVAGSRSGEGWKTYSRFAGGVFELDNSTANEKFIFGPFVPLVENEVYTLSFWYKTTDNVKDAEAYIYRNAGTVIQMVKSVKPTTEWTYVVHTFKANVTADCVFRFDNNGSTDGSVSTLYVKEPQLERGSQASPYLPSPIDVVVSTGKPATAQCTQAANRIEGYGTPTLVPSTIIAGDVPASGGTAGPIRFSGAQSEEYTSGDSLAATFNQDTAGVTVAISTSSPVSGSNLGTTLKARTLLGNLKFTISLHSRTSTEYSAPVYQQANELAAVEYAADGILSGPRLQSIPAQGGTTELYMKLKAIYTSGASRNVVPSVASPRSLTRWITAQRFEHATYGDCVRLIVPANTVGTTRSGVVAVTLSYNEGGRSETTTTNITITQLAD